MPNVNDVNFPENKFALMFLPTTENNFERQKQHERKKNSISNEKTNLVLKKKGSALNHITVYVLHFALISMETLII